MANKRKPKGRGGSADEPFTIETLEQFKALAHPLRQRILEDFARAPKTTKQVAEGLGEKPTRLYHHVHALERAGLIRLVETRPNRGTVEKYFSTVATRFQVDPQRIAGSDSDLSIEVAGAGVVDGLLSNLRTELSQLLDQNKGRADPDEALFVQYEVRGSADKIADVRERVETLLLDLQGDDDHPGPADADGAPHRLIIGWYPLPKRGDPSDKGGD